MCTVRSSGCLLYLGAQKNAKKKQKKAKKNWVGVCSWEGGWGVCSWGVWPGGCLTWGVSDLGCVWPGGCLLLGGFDLGGVCSWGGVCLGGGGWVSTPRGCLLWGVVSAPRGVSTLGGLLPGVSAPRGVVSQHVLRQTPPLCGQTHDCKNITFATSLRTVLITREVSIPEAWDSVLVRSKVLCEKFLFQGEWRVLQHRILTNSMGFWQHFPPLGQA